MDVSADRWRPTSASPLHPTLREAARSTTSAAAHRGGPAAALSAPDQWHRLAGGRAGPLAAGRKPADGPNRPPRPGASQRDGGQAGPGVAGRLRPSRGRRQPGAARPRRRDPAGGAGWCGRPGAGSGHRRTGPRPRHGGPQAPPGWGHAGHPRPRGPRILTEQERYPSQPRRQSATLGSATIYCSSGTNPVPGHRWPCGCRRLSRGHQMG
jgi:hypothetical protein